MNKKKWRIDTPFDDVKTVKTENGEEFVRIKGYASTFEEDRDGEIVEKDAFKSTKERFMQNPVILTDHKNEVAHVVGKVVDMHVDHKGLFVDVQLSNSDDEYTKMVRTKVREGILRAFSIGGMFAYSGNRIKEVDLMEISIVPVPANQSSLFEVAKSFDLDGDDSSAPAESGQVEEPVADQAPDADEVEQGDSPEAPADSADQDVKDEQAETKKSYEEIVHEIRERAFKKLAELYKEEWKIHG